MSNEGTPLNSLGWNRQGLAYPELKENAGIGRVVVEHRGAYELMGPFGSHEAILATSSREQADDPTDYPAVGDWVVHTLDPIDNRRLGIIKVLPRRSQVLRRASGTIPVPQVVGANIDVLGIVVSTDQEIDEQLIERYLVTAEGGGVSPTIIINKSDLGGGEEIRELLVRRGVQYPILLTNAHKSEELAEVAKLLTGGATLALTGASGVGKSTFDNSVKCLKERGTMVSFGNASGPLEPINVPKTLQPKGLFFVRPSMGQYLQTREELEEASKVLFEKISSGKVKVEIFKKYKLDEVKQAHIDLESRKIVGPAVIIP